MGRNVTLDFSAGGGSDTEFLIGTITLEPTAVHEIGNRVVLPAPRSTGINAGVGVLEDVAISPAGPEPAWAYRATVRDSISGKAQSWLVGVPSGTTAIPFNQLTKFTTTIPPHTTAGMMQNWADTAQDGATRAEDAADRAEAPTDEMNKTLIENPASLTSNALSAAIVGSFVDNGSRTKGRVSAGLDAVIYIAGDSTSASASSWPRKFLSQLGTDRPTVNMVHVGWDDPTQSLTSPETMHTGASPVIGGAGLDTFTRTASDIIGTSPDIGLAWQNPGASAGTWSLDGTKAVRTAGTGATEVYFRCVSPGEMTTTFQGVTLSTVGLGGGISRTNRFISQYVDTNNYIFAQVIISPGGGRIFNLNKRIGGVTTAISSDVIDPAAIPPSADAAALADIVVSMADQSITATIGATTITGTVSVSDRDALRSGDGVGLLATNQTGMSVERVTADTKTFGYATSTLTVYNGSFGGSTLAYQKPLIAQQCPTAPNVVVIASSHNYATTTEEYLAAVEDFVNTVRAQWPDVGIVVSSQNPRKAPAGAGGNTAHLERITALRGLASARGWGYVPIIEGFRAVGGGGTVYVGNDGVHPTPEGYEFWAELVKDWFLGL